ncbi:MAG: helix-turn-helix domain-containing protein [Clostridia bacterium]|jgi:hypothetical protein|nr:helix-turn-helix domain-containing protein [Clostridia bacterium]MDD4387489.1 helix-turn-helix domain-containing protein [Clostridia bacterium]
MEKNELKKVYDPIEIQKILGLGRTKLYEFLEKVYKNGEPFLVLKIGKQYKVPKEQFDVWINGGGNYVQY